MSLHSKISSTTKNVNQALLYICLFYFIFFLGCAYIATTRIPPATNDVQQFISTAKLPAEILNKKNLTQSQ